MVFGLEHALPQALPPPVLRLRALLRGAVVMAGLATGAPAENEVVPIRLVFCPLRNGCSVVLLGLRAWKSKGL